MIVLASLAVATIFLYTAVVDFTSSTVVRLLCSLSFFVFFPLWLILSHVTCLFPFTLCPLTQSFIRSEMSYVQSDKISSFEVTTIATTTGPLSEVYFPSVIVCSINQIRKSLFRVGSQKQQYFGHLRAWKHFSNDMHVNSGPHPQI